LVCTGVTANISPRYNRARKNATKPEHPQNFYSSKKKVMNFKALEDFERDRRREICVLNWYAVDYMQCQFNSLNAR
jgi:hypothetical protein